MKKVLIIIFFFFYTSAFGSTEDFYVCSDGNGAGLTDGSSEANCFDGFNDIAWDAEIEDADDDEVGPNDTLYLCTDGNYREALSVGSEGLSGKPLTITNQDGETPVIMTSFTTTWASTNANDYTSDANIISYWYMEEATGATRLDEMAVSNDLTDVNNVTQSTDPKQGTYSADFEATDNEYLTITDGNQTNLDPTSSFSIVAWVKFETVETGSGAQGIFDKYGAVGQRSYSLIQTADHVQFKVSGDGTASSSVLGVTELSTGTWYHVAGVFDDSADKIYIYLDGSPDKLTPGTHTGAIYDGTRDVDVGNDNYGNTLDGKLDEVAFFNRALSEAEIKEIWAFGLDGQGSSYLWASADTSTTDIGQLYFDGGTSWGRKEYYIGNMDTQGDFYYNPTSDKAILYSTTDPDSAYADIEVVYEADNSGEAAVFLDEKDYVTLRGLTVKYSGFHGIDIVASDYTIVEGCEVSWVGGSYWSGDVRGGNGIQLWGDGTGNIVRHNLVYEVYDSALTTQGTAENTKSNQAFYSNIVYNCITGFELWNRPDASILSNISYYNNTMFGMGDGWGYPSEQRDYMTPRASCFELHRNEANTTTDINIKNNICVDPADWWIYLVDEEWDGLVNLTFDYNLYYDSGNSGNFIQWQADTYTQAQFATYQSSKDQDTNSPTPADAKFTDTATDDYTLLETSPAISVGEDLGSSYDDCLDPGTSWVNNVITGDQGNSWEIGAYIYRVPIRSITIQ